MAKQETIKHLTDLMGVISNAYFKGRLGERNGDDTGGDGACCGELWVHEGEDGHISIDLYHFEGDGKPVCDGLKPCTVIFDDGTTDTGWLFCMCYNPDDVTPLVFVFSPDDEGYDYDIDPEDVPEDALTNITKWLEKAMVPAKPKSNDVTSFFYYMWNKWNEEECKAVFNDPHFWNKWCEAYDTMHGPRGATELFYMMLSDTNRDKLVARALECYDGMTMK